MKYFLTIWELQLPGNLKACNGLLYLYIYFEGMKGISVDVEKYGAWTVRFLKVFRFTR
jgi:hypothetical protein